MEERDFFDEKAEQRKHTLTCPHCGKQEEYEVAWLVRRKKAQLPGRADERDRARFAKAQSYMVRKDDVVGCKNVRCRKRFEVSSLQSVAVYLIDENTCLHQAGAAERCAPQAERGRHMDP